MNRATAGEHGKKHHTEGNCHDEVRQVDYRFEKTCAANAEPVVGKPGSQQKREHNLRDEAQNPHHHRIKEQARSLGCE